MKEGSPIEPETASQPGEKPDSLSAEQAVEVARLAQSIADSEKADPVPGEGDNADQDSAEHEARALSYDEEGLMAVDMFADMAIAYEPSVAPCWPPATRRRCGVALAAVLKKYNFSLFRSPELVLLITLGPPMFQTSKIIASVMNGKAEAAAKQHAD